MTIDQTVTIWLTAEFGTEPEYYRCSRCGMVVIEYDGKVMTEVPGNAPYTPATRIKCKGSYRKKDGTWEECGRYYRFMDSIRTKTPDV